MYGKLINDELVFAPSEFELDNGSIILEFDRCIAAMTEHGFKPVIDNKPHYNVDKQYCRFVGYMDTGRYIRYQWVVEDIEYSEAEIQNREAQKAMEMLNINFNEQVQALPDEQALEVTSVFPKWEVGVVYTVDFKVRHNDILYKVLQTHISQEGWTPDVAVSLFAKVLVGGTNEDGEQEILDWVQPDATNAYMTGDKVRYNGVVYESVIDNNVWSPSDYPAGWKEITE